MVTFASDPREHKGNIDVEDLSTCNNFHALEFVSGTETNPGHINEPGQLRGSHPPYPGPSYGALKEDECSGIPAYGPTT